MSPRLAKVLLVPLIILAAPRPDGEIRLQPTTGRTFNAVAHALFCGVTMMVAVSPLGEPVRVPDVLCVV